MNKLKRICSRNRLNYDQAIRMIVEYHTLQTMYKKSQLHEIEIDFKGDKVDLIDKYAKALRIDRSAVVSACLKDHIESKESK